MIKKIFLYIYLFLPLIKANIFSEINTFTDFINIYKKNYEHDEFQFRYNIFLNNKEFIETNNLYNENFKLKLNQFSDLSIDEFEKQYLLLNSKNINNYESLSSNKELKCSIDKNLLKLSSETPSEFDWEKENKVTCVKNQGNCGSCWAFSTVGAIESEYAIKKKKLLNLSEQELLDCADGEYENQGCNGGLMENGFHYVMDKGLCTEKEYPYEAKNNTCRICKEEIKISDCKEVPSYNETSLKYAVLQKPISVAVDASSLSFQFYSGGILNSGCGTRLNHAVLLVGYGEDNGKKYWRIKNSWGKNWGEDGYIRLARKDTNDKTSGMCGVTKQPSYPIL